MSEHIRESLSALMDGEANELEIERLLKQSGNEQLRGAWVRYHQVREVLGSRSSAYHSMDISKAVMSALEHEPAAVSRSALNWQSMLRPLASFAVAASVFSAVLVAGQFYGLLDGSKDAQLADRVSTVGMVNTLGGSAVRASYAAPALRPASNPVADYDKLAQQRLQRYMLDHSGEAALNSPQGMMPYARAATFQLEE